jgi:dTDP-4-dehydrorhamnose 3,5-epimerase-like enzyme
LNGFLCLSENCVLHYKLSYKGSYYDYDKQISKKWNDKNFNIKWPKRRYILSQRDK